MSKKGLIIILVLILLIVGVFLVLKKIKEREIAQQKLVEIQNLEKQKPKTTYLEFDKLPEKFPADFPMEDGAKLINNFNYDTPESVQATRSFESKKTLTTNFKIYQEYLSKNDWQIIAKIDQSEHKYLSGIKNGASLVVDITTNKTTKQNFVNASFVFSK